MALIVKNDICELIALVREIAIAETTFNLAPHTQTQQEIEKLQQQKERLFQLEVRCQLRTIEKQIVRKEPKQKKLIPYQEGSHDPNNLLDTLVQRLRLRNDASLSRALAVAPPVICKIRAHQLPVGATILLSMHEVSGISIKELRALMGDTHEKFSSRNQGITVK